MKLYNMLHLIKRVTGVGIIFNPLLSKDASDSDKL